MIDATCILFKSEFHQCDFDINTLFRLILIYPFSDHGCVRLILLEIDFRDILQRLRCMSACCYVKIAISDSELDGSVTENSDFCLL